MPRISLYLSFRNTIYYIKNYAYNFLLIFSVNKARYIIRYFFCFSYTALSVYSRVDRRNLQLTHSVPQVLSSGHHTLSRSPTGNGTHNPHNSQSYAYVTVPRQTMIIFLYKQQETNEGGVYLSSLKRYWNTFRVKYSKHRLIRQFDCV